MANTIFDDPREMSPTEWGLTHDRWRKGQAQSLRFTLQSGVNILEAPTGSGKTALPRAASTVDPTVAMCRTKNLQAENYDAEYGFDAMYGSGNYDCVHPDADMFDTAEDCQFKRSGVGMKHCPYSDNCPYLVALSRFMASPAGVCNYALWMSSRLLRVSPKPRLYLDEAHQLIPLVLDWVGLTVTTKERIEWGLPAFPLARPVQTRGPAAALYGQNQERSDPAEVVDNWLEKAQTRLANRIGELHSNAAPEKLLGEQNRRDK